MNTTRFTIYEGQVAGVGGDAVEQLIAGVTSDSAQRRTEAWLKADTVGAPALEPLAKVMNEAGTEVARAAKNGMWDVVRHAGRPGADEERATVEGALLVVLGGDLTDAVGRAVIRMLSEIGGDASLRPLAKKLRNKALREHARLALERIPGSRSLRTLKRALKRAPKDYKPAIAQSLRVRGADVRGYPCVSMTATRQTKVKPR